MNINRNGSNRHIHAKCKPVLPGKLVLQLRREVEQDWGKDHA